MATYVLDASYGAIVSSDGTNFSVLETLGVGGNSEVYLVLATDGELKGHVFALKLFVKIDDETRLIRFDREISFLSAVSHPSLLRVYDRGEVKVSQRSYPFAIFEYLPQTLFGALRTGLTMVEKVSFTLQLLSALRFLASQENPVVHRDIKLKNIFVRGESCILGDFGLMKDFGQVDPDNDQDFYLESIGPRMPWDGRTPDLVAYCRNEGDLTPQVDVYQLGLVLAQVFSGRSPLRRSRDRLDPVELDPLTSFISSQEEQINSLLEQMLIEDPETRATAESITDGWLGVFNSVASLSQSLEGRVFPLV